MRDAAQVIRYHLKAHRIVDQLQGHMTVQVFAGLAEPFFGQ
jgi:hypothetical protein